MCVCVPQLCVKCKKCHACRAKCKSMSPSATPATQSDLYVIDLCVSDLCVSDLCVSDLCVICV